MVCVAAQKDGASQKLDRDVTKERFLSYIIVVEIAGMPRQKLLGVQRNSVLSPATISEQAFNSTTVFFDHKEPRAQCRAGRRIIRGHIAVALQTGNRTGIEDASLRSVAGDAIIGKDCQQNRL